MFNSWFGRKSRDKSVADTSRLNDDTVRDTRVGDAISVGDLWPELEGTFFIVERVHRYASQVSEWFEIVSDEGQQKLWVEWADDDELFVTVSRDRTPMGLTSLNLTENDLARLDDERSIDNSVTYDGRQYLYKNSYEAFYFQDSKGQGEGFYLWEFASEDESSMLSIVKWENTPFQAFASEIVSPDSVVVTKR